MTLPPLTEGRMCLVGFRVEGGRQFIPTVEVEAVMLELLLCFSECLQWQAPRCESVGAWWRCWLGPGDGTWGSEAAEEGRAGESKPSEVYWEGSNPQIPQAAGARSVMSGHGVDGTIC